MNQIHPLLFILRSAAATGLHRLSLKVMHTLDKHGPFCACAASFDTVDINTFLKKMSANERGRLFFPFSLSSIFELCQSTRKTLAGATIFFFLRLLLAPVVDCEETKRAEEFRDGQGH